MIATEEDLRYEGRPQADRHEEATQPSERHDAIEDWTRHQMPDLQPVVERLDATIRDTIRGCATP